MSKVIASTCTEDAEFQSVNLFAVLFEILNLLDQCCNLLNFNKEFNIDMVVYVFG